MCKPTMFLVLLSLLSSIYIGSHAAGHETNTNCPRFYDQGPLPCLPGITGKKILSYSLWGKSDSDVIEPTYMSGIIYNLVAARTVYPGWGVRVYTVHDRPKMRGWFDEFCAAGVDVVLVNNTLMQHHMALWRVLPWDDSCLDAVVVRDLDSRVTWREAAAVDEWLATNRSIHLMRDAKAHYYPVMAGMFGVRPNLLRTRPADFNMREMVEAPLVPHARNWDQTFLTRTVWNTFPASDMVQHNFAGVKNLASLCNPAEHPGVLCKDFPTNDRCKYQKQKGATGYFVGARMPAPFASFTYVCDLKPSACHLKSNVDWVTLMKGAILTSGRFVELPKVTSGTEKQEAVVVSMAPTDAGDGGGGELTRLSIQFEFEKRADDAVSRKEEVAIEHIEEEVLGIISEVASAEGGVNELERDANGQGEEERESEHSHRHVASWTISS
eukprot:TRINITY_DN17636_c0_g1_i1.p1 TRINITY_DN17636_c0_g1~~TRINITY_DN17636_c0_g1_i1.p1  ORF type:complete len:480 (+),score=38.96 TRINITY_DN17636_c0_g1_i1:125-1441(+)